MNVYLAARYERRAEMFVLSLELQRYNITVTSRWINGSHDEGDNDLPTSTIARFAQEDIEDLKRADVLVFFAEKTRGRGGRHVELGYALALERPVIIVGGHEHIFSYLPEIVHVPDWDRALMVLYAWSKQETESYKQHVQEALEGKSERYTSEELKKELGLDEPILHLRNTAQEPTCCGLESVHHYWTWELKYVTCPDCKASFRYRA